MTELPENRTQSPLFRISQHDNIVNTRHPRFRDIYAADDTLVIFGECISILYYSRMIKGSLFLRNLYHFFRVGNNSLFKTLKTLAF